MQHQGRADAGAQMFGVGSDGEQGLGSRSEQNTVEHCLVVIRDITDRRWQGEDQVIVVHGQEVCLASFQPAPGGAGLALRAVAVAAGVVGDLSMLTGRALQNMAAERRAAAAFDGRHDLELAEA